MYHAAAESTDRYGLCGSVRAERVLNDVQDLDHLQRNAWRGRFALEAAEPTGERSLLITARLMVPSLVMQESDPGDTALGGALLMPGPFHLCLDVPLAYPLQVPSVYFNPDDDLWNPHVIHPAGLPVGDMDPEIRAYVERGKGHVCFMDYANEWSALAPVRCNLAMIVWWVSRVLAQDPKAVNGEMMQLNPRARDLFMDLKGRPKALPLGKPLPVPVRQAQKQEVAS